MIEQNFTNPFPPAADAQWREAVAKVLKGADFDRKLVSRTLDGIAIAPLSQRRPDAMPVAGARAGQRWRATARVDHPDPQAASAQALADLDGGADSLALVFQGAGSARGFGLPTADSGQLAEALAGVRLDLISTRIEPAPQARIVARLFAEVVRGQGLNPAELQVEFGFDPVGLLARSGVLLTPWAEVTGRLADMLAEFGGQGFVGPFITCDARIVHEAGGSEAQELAYALASAVTYLRTLEAGGVPLDRAAAALSFSLSIDADQFMGIAKLRALRRLMARIRQACYLPDVPVTLHAETAWRMLTRYDVATNMLRNAIAVFAAGVGGADSVTVLPHTAALGLPDGFARRIARNMQGVLAEESHLWRVIDPSAGSGSIEALTDELCAKAWAAFQAIEAEGGLVAALQSGVFQRRVAEIASARRRGIATGRLPLTGVSAFPDLLERPEGVLDVEPVTARRVAGGAIEVLALQPERLSQPFEALRERAAALGQPRIFLANLGSLAAFTPRAGFARGFFEAGGIAAVGNDGFADADGSTDLIALTDAFKASGARLACLCGTDEAYAAEATDAALALTASGAAGVWLAGRPGDDEAARRAAGISGFVFMGADMLAALDDALGQIAS